MSVFGLVDWLGLGHNMPQIKPTTLPISYFKFPPSSVPATVPPPPAAPHEPTLAHPFTIPTDVYNDLLKAQVPITFALVYMSMVIVFNQANANRNYKPWAISRTRIFKLLVILHNIFLAVYSAWTFVGMANALIHSLPAFDEDWKISKTVDTLCKLHGPRGAGNAATYNSTTGAWGITNRLFHLAADGLGPEATDAGRIWNEGLAFYGWLFYLSKFYEIVDTLIIMLKGRKSSLLQTYHHAGAMLSMWAGIRYMSPPIWMFVLYNSGIHAIMYTFYLFSTLGIKVPKWFKQTLTTLQISQFVVGTIFAFAHLFVAYQVPVSVPYLYHLGGVASKVLSDAPTQITSTIATAVSTQAGYGSWLKKAVLRGAGYEGLAENVLNEYGKPFGVDAAHIVRDTVRREETRYRDELQFVHCLDTSGQVFAVLLNCVYLLPLTWLFVQFFVTAYVNQIERRRSRSASDTAIVAGNSFIDASKGVSRRLTEAVQEMHNISEDIGDDTVFVDGDEIKREMKEAAEQAKSAISRGNEKLQQSAKESGLNPEAVKQGFQRDMEAARKTLQNTADKVKDAAAQATNPEARDKVVAKAQALRDSAADAVGHVVDNVKSVAGSAKEQAGPTVDAAADKAAELKNRAMGTGKNVVNQAKEEAPETVDQAKDTAKKTVDSAKDSTQKAAGKARESAPKLADQAKDTANKAADSTKENAKKSKDQAGESTQKANDSAEITAEQAQSKADDLSKKIDENLAKGSPSKDKSKQSEVEKFTSESRPKSSGESSSPTKKNPNGNGTGGAGASPTKKSNNHKNDHKHEKKNQGEGVKAEVEESEQTKSEKKKEDKIIDESQVVRDEDVDTEKAQGQGLGQGKSPQKKKTEDKIIDESQLVRDEDVDTQKGNGKSPQKKK